MGVISKLSGSESLSFDGKDGTATGGAVTGGRVGGLVGEVGCFVGGVVGGDVYEKEKRYKTRWCQKSNEKLVTTNGETISTRLTRGLHIDPSQQLG